MLVKSECKALFYAEELAAGAVPLKDIRPEMIVKSVLSLIEMLETPEDTGHYPYDKSFEEARDEPCLILHSSGSTGSRAFCFGDIEAF